MFMIHQKKQWRMEDTLGIEEYRQALSEIERGCSKVFVIKLKYNDFSDESLEIINDTEQTINAQHKFITVSCKDDKTNSLIITSVSDAEPHHDEKIAGRHFKSVSTFEGLGYLLTHIRAGAPIVSAESKVICKPLYIAGNVHLGTFRLCDSAYHFDLKKLDPLEFDSTGNGIFHDTFLNECRQIIPFLTKGSILSFNVLSRRGAVDTVSMQVMSVLQELELQEKKYAFFHRKNRLKSKIN